MYMTFLAQNKFPITSPWGIQERAGRVRRWAWSLWVCLLGAWPGPARAGLGPVGGVGGRDGQGWRCNTHCTARAEPFTIRDLGQRWVEAVQVVGGRTGIAAQKLATVLAHAAELHVVILLLLPAAALLLFLVIVLRLPLDSLLLL